MLPKLLRTSCEAVDPQEKCEWYGALLTFYGQNADSEPMIILGVLLALLAIASGVLVIFARSISQRLPESYFKYSGQSVRPWWVNDYYFHRRSSRESWVKSTRIWFPASFVVLSVAALAVLR